MEWWGITVYRLGVPALVVRFVHPAREYEGRLPHMPGWVCSSRTLEGEVPNTVHACIYPPVSLGEDPASLALRLADYVIREMPDIVAYINDTFYTFLVTPSTLVAIATYTELYSSDWGRPKPRWTQVCVAHGNVRLCAPGAAMVDGRVYDFPMVHNLACIMDDRCLESVLRVLRGEDPQLYTRLAKLLLLTRRLVKLAYETLGTDLDTIAVRKLLEEFRDETRYPLETYTDLITSLGEAPLSHIDALIEALEAAIRELEQAQHLLTGAHSFNLEAFGLRAAQRY